MHKRPEGFPVTCGFDRVRALLSMNSDDPFLHDHFYRCERGIAEFSWNGGHSMYVYPLTEWPDQDPFWEMMKLLNSESVSLEELSVWGSHS